MGSPPGSSKAELLLISSLRWSRDASRARPTTGVQGSDVTLGANTQARLVFNDHKERK